MLGRPVTGTVYKFIAKQEAFYDEPSVMMFGQLCALLATGLWLLTASYLELPVSTTHSIGKSGGILQLRHWSKRTGIGSTLPASTTCP